MLMAVIQKPRNTASTDDVQGDGEGEWMSLNDLFSMLKNHFKGYKEDEGTFRKIGNYLSRPEYKFQSKHTNAGVLYWVKRKV